jgi:hypothetical protein
VSDLRDPPSKVHSVGLSFTLATSSTRGHAHHPGYVGWVRESIRTPVIALGESPRRRLRRREIRENVNLSHVNVSTADATAHDQS